MINIHELLELAIRHRASDLLLKAGSAPALRIDGTIATTRMPPLTAAEMQELARSVVYTASRDDLLLSFDENLEGNQSVPDVVERHLHALTERQELDLVFTIPNLIRVRANLFVQQSTIAAALRIIPLRPLTVEELNLPGVLRELANHQQGLLLVTGPTGSGKSTTLAALLDHVNNTRRGTIITIEDPIEYVLEDNHCVVFQREIGRDTRSFANALRSVLRQSPDVIMVGEMRDAETMAIALQAAEMGHLVLSSIHTTSAAATIDRIINVFPPHEAGQIRAALAASLIGVVSLRLLKRLPKEQPGRVPAVEVLINTPSVRKHIEDGNLPELYAAIREGRHFGMNTLNQALERLYHGGLVGYDDAIAASVNPQELRQMVRREAH